MNKDLKEMEQIYCLEIPKGIKVGLEWHGTKGMSSIGFRRKGLDEKPLSYLFDVEALFEKFLSFGLDSIEIAGIINGPTLTFTVFDVKLNKDWISVPLAAEMSKFLKFDFVKYSIVPPREVEFQTGVILKPIHECVNEDGNRISEEVKG